MADLDWAEMEGLFCQQAPLAPSSQSSPRLGRDPQDPDRRRKESSEIALLDGKRSLNVNIFLKQFRSSNEDIIQLIRDGAHDDIGAEKLRGLLKILPEVDELEMLRSFDGDRMKLGNAEKFLLQLIEVPNYKLRIESMLLKEEFAANMGYLEPSINSMIVAGEDLMTNKPLQEVLYMVLVAGNFLNSGGYAGNAAGVKLSSLQKLTDIRANKPGMNLIHYVALQAEKKRTELLRFPEEMTALEDATKTTVEQLQNEINALDSRIKKVRKEIDRPSTEKEIKLQMGEFLQMAEQEVSGLQRDMEELETMRKTLSEFFCEDSTTFKLEECFRVFHGFCVKFRQAVAENERRRIQEEQANARRRQREEQLAARRRQQMAGQPGSESECNLVDSLLYDIRSGFQQSKGLNGSSRDLRTRKVQNGGMTSEEDMSSITGSPLVARRRMGSFSGPTGEQAAANGREEGYSPDVTPNGSLRRRRSRVPSEEDDSNLMDFLRSSGHDGSRERKSWGSLDRSWARRARGSGGRKRPDLLSADFSGERERPSSPSPLLETKPVLPSTPEGESKPKAWRQKIEAWLQENEKEEKQNEELRRRSRRVQSNRRSLEADSESEGRGSTLDTLPEEKSTNTQYKRVYSDWRPTIEKTDVVGAMEAIEEAQPQTPVKDKSPWRKSNLNVPNSAEETELDMRRLRRMQSRGSVDAGSASSNPLQAIKEEDKRKGMICSLGDASQEQDRLTLYLDPARSQLLHKYHNVPGDVLRSIVGEEPPTVPRRLRRPPREEQGDIDADNVETPPATRRRPIEPEEESLGDGQFDRFAAARRTRRYKKTSDYSSDRDDEPLPVRRTEVVSPELVSEKQVIRPTTLHVKSVPVAEKSPEQAENTQTRLKKWQERLKYRGGGRDEDAALADIASAGRELQQLEQLRPARVSQRERIRSMIDPRQVEEALRCSRATPTVPEEKPVTERMNSEFIPQIKVNASTPSHVKGRSEHDLNDEGFEETQSLVSETPSQGTSSDAVDSPSKSKRRPGRIIRADSSGSSSSNTVPVASTPAATPAPTTAVASRTRLEPRGGLGRSSSVRGEGRVSVIPRRTASLRKTDSQASLSRRERSNSHTSLRSSRSSLNSAASVNTVKNAMSCTPPLSKSSSRSSVQGARLSGYTTAIKTLTSNLSKQPVRREVSSPTKKPLGPVQLKTSSQRSVPASRSSSSGSSIGPSVRRPRVTSGVSTSFKENATTSAGRPGSVPASRSSSSGSSVGPAVRRPVQQRNNLSFMRPTAASAAKDSIGSDATKLRKTVK